MRNTPGEEKTVSLRVKQKEMKNYDIYNHNDTFDCHQLHMRFQFDRQQHKLHMRFQLGHHQHKRDLHFQNNVVQLYIKCNLDTRFYLRHTHHSLIKNIMLTII